MEAGASRTAVESAKDRARKNVFDLSPPIPTPLSARDAHRQVAEWDCPREVGSQGYIWL